MEAEAKRLLEEEKERNEREEKICREASAGQKEKEANLSKLLVEFDIQGKDASNLAAAGVKTAEDLMLTLPEDIAAFNLSVIGKRKLEKLLEHVRLLAAAKQTLEHLRLLSKKQLHQGAGSSPAASSAPSQAPLSKPASTPANEGKLLKGAQAGGTTTVVALLEAGEKAKERADAELARKIQMLELTNTTTNSTSLPHAAQTRTQPARTQQASTPDNERKLRKAAGDGDTTTVVALLKAGTNVDCRCLDEWSPMHKAAQYNSPEVAKVLLSPT